jgi:hypothetical protein
MCFIANGTPEINRQQQSLRRELEASLVQARVPVPAAVPHLRQFLSPLRSGSNRLVRSSRAMKLLPLPDWTCGFSAAGRPPR